MQRLSRSTKTVQQKEEEVFDGEEVTEETTAEETETTEETAERHKNA